MKIFAVSDVHGFFTEMKTALDEAGFDPENENHWLFVLGDIIDRGREPEQIIEYLLSLPRKVLIRGNHEDLFESACQRCRCLSHDIHNGTLQTILDLNNPPPMLRLSEYNFSEAYRKMKPILDSMVDYFETENYIFTHAWLPTPYLLENENTSADWHCAETQHWNKARWCNPFEIAPHDPQGKTVVFGHWHASAGWAEKENRSEFGTDARFDIFYGEGYIALDACTAHTGKVNCLVIDDNFTI